MANYSYKGTNIRDILSNGTSTISQYTNFPTFARSNFTITDKPLDFGFKLNNQAVIDLSMVANYVEYSTTGTYTAAVPTWADKIHFILIGGGGGAGGSGGCGYGAGPRRHSGGAGAPGAPGNYVAYTDNEFNVSGGNISVTVGSAGTTGGNGPNKGTGSFGSGGSGAPGGNGNDSSITYGNISLVVGGGGGGIAGNGGNSASSDAPTYTNLTPSSNGGNFSLAVNQSISNDSSFTPWSLPNSSYNPIGYQGSSGTTGAFQQSGKVRIYFLKS